MIGNLNAPMTRPLPTDTEAVRLLARHADLIKQMMALAKPELRQLVATHVHDLVVLALGPARHGAEIAKGSRLREVRLRAIKADIVAHLGARDLSLDGVAARQGISPIYVRKLFEEEDTSFTQFVLDQRLARTHRLLSDPDLAGHTIATLALEAGFGDLSYFNRAFRRRFGRTPSHLRGTAHRIATSRS
jgi:AraC-like DNA-binding protein